MSHSVLTRTPASPGSPASPASPAAQRRIEPSRWRDPKLAAGIVLVAASVIAGSLIVGSSDDRVLIWSASRDLATGTELRPGDLVATAVRLDAASEYLSAESAAPDGRRLTRQIGAGELLPAGAISTADAGAQIGSPGGQRRIVTLPVEPMHVPPGLGHGDRVDIYVSPRNSSAAEAGSSRLVLASALVSELTAPDSASGEVAIAFDVTSDQAGALVAAGRSGVIDIARLPASAQ